MDNNFYEKRSEKKRKKEQQNQNPMFKVIIVQLILSIIISGILFFICRTDSNLSQNIKAFYKEISKTDIAVSTILDEFKSVAKQTFAPTLVEETTSEEIVKETGE